jgi:glyoxylase-like metal-dependent hydrolase (beta-lactamase superfamily II)
MNPEIITIQAGVTRCYLIRGDSEWVLVDCGSPGSLKKIQRHLKKRSISPADIKLIILTHGHFDHCGSADAVRQATGAKVLIHSKDLVFMEKCLNTFPKGVSLWGKTLRLLVKTLVIPFFRRQGTQADIVLAKGDFPLPPYGIAGRVVHSPGHTPGSMSVLLDSGEAFVGDLAFNGPPFCRKPRMVFEDDVDQVRRTWKNLLRLGIKTVYPSHGKPFPADQVKTFISGR